MSEPKYQKLPQDSNQSKYEKLKSCVQKFCYCCFCLKYGSNETMSDDTDIEFAMMKYGQVYMRCYYILLLYIESKNLELCNAIQKNCRIYDLPKRNTWISFTADRKVNIH